MKLILIATTLIGLASTNMLEKRGIPNVGDFDHCLEECQRCYASWNAATDSVDVFIAGNCQGSLKCGPSVPLQGAANLFMCTQACYKHAIKELYEKNGKCCNSTT